MNSDCEELFKGPLFLALHQPELCGQVFLKLCHKLPSLHGAESGYMLFAWCSYGDQNPVLCSAYDCCRHRCYARERRARRRKAQRISTMGLISLPMAAGRS